MILGYHISRDEWLDGFLAFLGLNSDILLWLVGLVLFGAIDEALAPVYLSN